MRVIKVRGTGKASQSPDLIVINLEISSQRYEYDTAMDDLNRRTAILKNDLANLGFSRDEIKTSNFNVETMYRYMEGKRVFDGYKATQDFQLTFDFNKLLLNQTLRVLSNTQAKPSFNIEFTVKDKQAFKNKVLSNAVLNARKSALVIADTLGVELGDIVDINYDYQDFIPVSRLVLQEASYMMEADSEVDVDPADVEKTDAVDVSWEIRNVY